MMTLNINLTCSKTKEENERLSIHDPPIHNPGRKKACWSTRFRSEAYITDILTLLEAFYWCGAVRTTSNFFFSEFGVSIKMTEEAVLNTYARIGASALTWPIEKSKLLYQGGGGGSGTANAHGNATGGRLIWNLLCKIPIQQHLAGMASSGLQRGGSAFFMFYTQSQIHQFTHGISSTSWLDQAIAGGVSGAITAPFHTYWELIKVRGMLPSSQAYLVCLKPMILRHTIFDATFFGVNTAIGNDTHASWRFALAAASASFANLLWDVWKTRQMEGFPKRVFFVREVLRSMTVTSFLRNYIVKGTDLTANWFAVGCLKDAFFPSPTQQPE